jgi:hypothetical protein
MTPALEEPFMRLIEKKSRFSAKHGALSLIAASLALLISAALASASSLSSGQNKDGKPDFTGKWKVESLTKEAGEPPLPPGAEKEINEVAHKDPELKIIRSYEERPGVLELRLTTDGKEGTITELNGSTNKSKADWSGKRLIISMGGEYKETWGLDDDRKTLIITKEFQDIRWKMVYKRQ